MDLLARVENYLSSLPDRSKRMNEKFTLTDFKNHFRQDNLLDKMQSDDRDFDIPTG
jgi:hypothetical protein